MGLLASAAEAAVSVVAPEAALPLRIFNMIRSGAGKALAWVTGSATHLLIATLLVSNGAWFVAYQIQGHALAKQTTHAAQLQAAMNAVRSANQAAIAQATAEKKAKEAHDAQIAAQADATAADLAARYHAIVLRLADAQSGARGADLPQSAGSPQGGDRSGPGAGLSPGTVTIPTADALTCGENTARLQAVHDWATALGH